MPFGALKAGAGGAESGAPGGEGGAVSAADPACESARADGAPGCAHYQRRCKLVAPW